MRPLVQSLVAEVAAGHAGSFATITSVSEPSRFVQWMTSPTSVRVEAAGGGDPGALWALGLEEDTPGWAAEVMPQEVEDLVVAALQVLGISEPVEISQHIETELFTPQISAADASPVGAGREAERWVLVFERPDGRARFAVSRDPDDYLQRLHSGEWASRSLPKDAVLRGQIPLADAGAVEVKEPLNGDRALGDAVLAHLRSETPVALEGWRAALFTTLTQGVPVAYEHVASFLREWGEERAAARAAKGPAKPRKPTPARLTAGAGEIETQQLPELALRAARGTRCTWAWMPGGVLLRVDDSGEITTDQLPDLAGRRPMWLAASPDHDAIWATEIGPGWVRAPDGQVHPLPAGQNAATTDGLLVMLADNILAMHGWDGAERWRTTKPFGGHRSTPVATRSQAYVISEERLWPVDLTDGKIGRPLQAPPSETEWHSRRIAAAGSRGDVLHVTTGSTVLTLDHDRKWSTHIDLADHYAASSLLDTQDELVGFLARGTVIIPAHDGAPPTILDVQRRETGQHSSYAALADDRGRLLVNGRQGQGPPNGVDLFDLHTRTLTHTLDTGRAQVSAAWLTDTGFACLAGPAHHRIHTS